MMQICRCCDQVIPETEEEKRVAAGKTVFAKEQIFAAQTAWEIFSRVHPAQGFWARNPELGVFISFCVAMAVFGYFVIPIPAPLQFSIELVMYMIISIVAGCTSLHFLVKRAIRKLNMHNKAVRNAFSIRYKESAERLGFRAKWQ